MGRFRKPARLWLNQFRNSFPRQRLERSICSGLRETWLNRPFGGDLPVVPRSWHSLPMRAGLFDAASLIGASILARASHVSILAKSSTNQMSLRADGGAGQHDWGPALEFGDSADSSAPGRDNFRDSSLRLAISVASQIALSLASLQLRDTFVNSRFVIR